MPSQPRLTRQNALYELADSQRGYFSAGQAKALGYPYQIQHYHLQQGNWQGLMRGVYRLKNYPSETLDYLAMLMVWSQNRHSQTQAVVGFESALLLHELSDVLPAQTHLIVPVGFRKKPPENVVLHKAKLEPTDVAVYHGVHLTTPLKTLLDLHTTAISDEHLQQALKEALARGMVRQKKLFEALETIKTPEKQRWQKTLKAVGL